MSSLRPSGGWRRIQRPGLELWHWPAWVDKPATLQAELVASVPWEQPLIRV